MKIRISLRYTALILIAALAIGLTAALDSTQARIPSAEFAKIIKSFSEEEGYFFSDNLISNEDGYLAILDKMRELGISGKAYIGVGPEQNFTYIARTRPSIAFLIDIRRQAMIQHLMYKALFHLSKDRAEFLSRLLSRPLKGKDAPGADSTLRKLMEYFSITSADFSYYSTNLSEVERLIQSEFEFPLSKEDREALAHITQSFYTEGVYISFKFTSYYRRGGFGMPSMRELIEQVGPDGKPGNFLASAEDYQFVRDLHMKNKIIPVVGDFAGTKTLRSIARYLRDHAYKVNVFYTSNVEMYLFENDAFDDFVRNVKSLPLADGSIFIRSSNNFRGRGRRFFSGYLMTTRLQYISVFLKDYQDGLYTDYWTLVNSNYIP